MEAEPEPNYGKIEAGARSPEPKLNNFVSAALTQMIVIGFFLYLFHIIFL